MSVCMFGDRHLGKLETKVAFYWELPLGKCPRVVERSPYQWRHVAWWRHSGDVITFKMLLLPEFLSELDDFYVVRLWSTWIVDPGFMTSLMTSWKLSDIRVWFLLRTYRKSSMLSRMVMWPMTSQWWHNAAAARILAACITCLRLTITWPAWRHVCSLF